MGAVPEPWGRISVHGRHSKRPALKDRQAAVRVCDYNAHHALLSSEEEEERQAAL